MNIFLWIEFRKIEILCLRDYRIYVNRMIWINYMEIEVDMKVIGKVLLKNVFMLVSRVIIIYLFVIMYLVWL